MSDSRQPPPAPEPPADVSLGLTLSGGGFRATLFHLGVTKCLADAHCLGQVSRLCSVSGGSVIAAYLLLHWESLTTPGTAFDDCARRLLGLCQHDLRGRLIRRWISWPFARLFTEKARTSEELFGKQATRSMLFISFLEEFLGQSDVSGRKLNDLCDKVDGHLLATSLSTGRLFSFSKTGIASFAPGSLQLHRELDVTDAPLSFGVAASAAFPPLFPPLRLDPERLTGRQDAGAIEWLSDGGVFDNLGVAGYQALSNRAGSAPTLLIMSDAGQPLDAQFDTQFGGIIDRVSRSTDLLMQRLAAHERAQHTGAISVQIGAYDFSEDERNGSLGLTPRQLLTDSDAEKLGAVRTDLDVFSREVCYALIRHGYEKMMLGLLRCEQTRDWEAVRELATNYVPWNPVGVDAQPETLNTALSGERVRRKRLYSSKDGVSRIHLALLVVSILVLGVVLLLRPTAPDPLYDDSLLAEARAAGEPYFVISLVSINTVERAPGDEPKRFVRKRNVYHCIALRDLGDGFTFEEFETHQGTVTPWLGNLAQEEVNDSGRQVRTKLDGSFREGEVFTFMTGADYTLSWKPGSRPLDKVENILLGEYDGTAAEYTERFVGRLTVLVDSPLAIQAAGIQAFHWSKTESYERSVPIVVQQTPSVSTRITAVFENIRPLENVAVIYSWEDEANAMAAE